MPKYIIVPVSVMNLRAPVELAHIGEAIAEATRMRRQFAGETLIIFEQVAELEGKTSRLPTRLRLVKKPTPTLTTAHVPQTSSETDPETADTERPDRGSSQ